MNGSNRPTVPVPPMVEVTTSSEEEGVCRVCDGRVVVEYQSTEVFGSTRIRQYVSSIHCEDCGVIYKFLPPSLKK